MSLYYRSLIQEGKLLDIYPNATVAFSLRKLRDAYSGSAIRVRRGVDSTELDVGFNSSGDLDTDAIVNFFGNNLLLQSENFEVTGGWARTGSNVIAGSIVGPNGVDLSCKFNETATSGFHILTATQFGTTIGKNYLFSIYLKAGERNIIDFVSLVDATNTCRLNLTTGAIVSNNFTNTPTLTDAGNGWWKFELIVTASNTLTSTGFQLRLTNGTTQSYVGTVGWGCYVWGAQVSGYTGTPVPYFRTTTLRANDVRIVTFYDQSGNGNNSTQLTPSIQHLICQNGFITRNTNNKPVVLLSAVAANFYTPISTIPTTSPHFSASIYNYTGGNFSTFGNRSVVASPQVIYQSTTNLVYRFTNNGADSLSVPYTTTGNQIITTSRVVTDMQLYGNNSLIGNRNTAFAGATIPITNITSHVSGSQIVRGELFEMIFWNQNYTSLRSDITNKINEYYGIY